MTAILDLHHAQIMIPPGGEEEARRFYCGVLGLAEIAKPAALAVRGGFWLAVGTRQIHVGVEAPGVDRRATRAHVAYEVDALDDWRARLAAAGVTVLDGSPIPGYLRTELRDPFGNRVELLQRTGV